MLKARIGQLLGEPEQGRRTDLEPVPHEGEVAKNERMDFRVIARALNGGCDLSKDEWRQSRPDQKNESHSAVLLFR
jgi:hypothetical protein